MLAGAARSQRGVVHNGGDLDSQGFAMLSQRRPHLFHAQSLINDTATLLAHRS